MALRIRWTPRAAKKLENLEAYLVKEWGEKVVRGFFQNLDSFLNLLKDYPGIGQIEDEEKAIRSFVLSSQTSIFYRIEDDCIIILNLFDNRQNPEKR